MKESKKTVEVSPDVALQQEIQIEGPQDKVTSLFEEARNPEETKKPEEAKKSEEEQKVEEVKGKPAAPPKPEMVPFSHFFMYCTPGEKVMLYMGYLACVLAGLLIPSISILMGEITVSFDPTSTRKDTLDAMRRLNIAI